MVKAGKTPLTRRIENTRVNRRKTLFCGVKRGRHVGVLGGGGRRADRRPVLYSSSRPVMMSVRPAPTRTCGGHPSAAAGDIPSASTRRVLSRTHAPPGLSCVWTENLSSGCRSVSEVPLVVHQMRWEESGGRPAFCGETRSASCRPTQAKPPFILFSPRIT